LSSFKLNSLCTIFPSALQPRPITAISFGLTAAPHHGDIHSALQPRPIHGDIFFGLAAMPHGNNRFFVLCLMARIDFIPPEGDSCLTAISIFSSPHGDNQFFFASLQESISFHLTAIRATWRYQFFFASRR
jgi:hypothetical protein